MGGLQSAGPARVGLGVVHSSFFCLGPNSYGNEADVVWSSEGVSQASGGLALAKEEKEIPGGGRGCTSRGSRKKNRK